MLTYQDAIDHLVDYLGGTPTEVVQRDCRRAVAEAYRDLTNAFRWSYLLKHGRVITTAMISSGAVQYDQATRRVVLTPDPASSFQAWPAYAVGCYLRIGFVGCKIVRRVDDVTLELDDQVNFGQDYPAATPYLFYRDSYVLPEDFVASDQALYERNFGGMQYVHPREWLFEERFIFAQGIPQCYTITGDTLFPGRLVMRLTPLPAEQKTIDFVYHRRPRPLQIATVSTGTVSTSVGSTTVAGTGTTFDRRMVGSVFRVSDSLSSPTSPYGKNPAAHESVIAAVTDALTLELHDAALGNLFGAYTVSDPVDIEEGAMANVFFRCIEKHIANNRTLKDKPSAAALYQEALGAARAADSRTFSGRAVGDHWPYRQRLRDMPIDLSRIS